MAGIYDFNTDQGATLQQLITWRQPQTTQQVIDDEDGTPVDLTGYTARMQLRTAVDSDAVVLELTTENDRIILGDQEAATPTYTNGQIRLLVDAETMEDVPAAKYKYDLELISAGGIVTRLLQGKIKVVAEVTREV